MHVGEAILYDEEAYTICNIHDNGTVTIQDLNQVALTVDQDDIIEVE